MTAWDSFSSTHWRVKVTLPIQGQLAIQELKFFADSTCTTLVTDSTRSPFVQSTQCTATAHDGWINSDAFNDCSCDNIVDNNKRTYWVSNSSKYGVHDPHVQHWFGVKFFKAVYVGCVQVHGRILPPLQKPTPEDMSVTSPSILSAGLQLQRSHDDGFSWQDLLSLEPAPSGKDAVCQQSLEEALLTGVECITSLILPG